MTTKRKPLKPCPICRRTPWTHDATEYQMAMVMCFRSLHHEVSVVGETLAIAESRWNKRAAPRRAKG